MRKDCETHLSNFLKRPVMSMQSVSLYQYTLHRINVYERNMIVFQITAYNIQLRGLRCINLLGTYLSTGCEVKNGPP